MVEQRKSRWFRFIHRADGHFSLSRIVVLFSIAMVMLNLAIFVKGGVDSYHTTLQQARAQLSQLSHTVTGYLSTTFLGVDITMERVLEKQRFNENFGYNLYQDVANNVQNWAESIPQIAGIMLADEDGNFRIQVHKKNYLSLMENKESIGGEWFFHVHRLPEADQEERFYTHYQDRDGKEYVLATRRISKIDGSFGGVIMVLIDSQYILSFFRAIEPGKRTRLVLSRGDNKLLISNVRSQPTYDLRNRLIRQHNILREVTSAEPILTRDHQDQQMRLVAFRHIPQLDMFITILLHSDDILANWWENRFYDLWLFIAFVVFISIITLFAIAIIRQMRKVEQSERSAVMASQAKSEFLANMSHELRTPLNAIIGFSEMMGSGYFGKLNSKQTERVTDINNCGNHLLELINDVLEFSKGAAGRLELHLEKINIIELVRETLRIFRDRVDLQEITLTTDLPTSIPPLILDGRKIKQTLINLLSNAIKFSHHGGTVEIQLKYTEKYVTLTVIDHGIGMREEDIPLAMEAFGQTHEDPAYGGTGLGLPLCKTFTELHGGSLEISSTPNEGTRATAHFRIQKELRKTPLLTVISAFRNKG